MPVKKSNQGAKTATKRGQSIPKKKGGSKIGKILSQTAKDFGEIARSTPAGVVQLHGAIDSALPRGPLERGNEKHNDYTGIKDIGKAQIQAVKDLRHPLRHPGYSLLTALGIAAPVAKVGTVGATVAKTGKLPKKGKPPTRKLTYRARDLDPDSKEQKTLRSVSGRRDKPTITEQSVILPASKVPTTRLAQEVLDKIRMRNPDWQKRKVLKGVARDRDIIDRLERPALQKGVIGATKEAASKESWGELRNPGQWIPEINAGVRGARLFRPGYILPNLGGSIATNLIEGPVKSYKAGVASRKFRGEGAKQRIGHRDIDPETQADIDRIDAIMGEGAAQGAAEQGLRHTDDGRVISGPLSTFMRGVGQSLGKITDRESRRRHFFREAEAQGIDIQSPEAIHALLNSPRLRKDLLQIARRAEPSAIKFTRTRNLEGVPKRAHQKLDQKLAENIFLYRWLTGSAAYTGRMVAEHPTLSAALAAQGTISPQIDDVLEEYPKFMSRYIPVGMRDKLPLVSNLQAATLFDSPGELADLIGEIGDDPRNAIDPLAPFQRGAAVAALGYDPFRRQELATRANPTPGILERLAFGSDVETRSIPYRTLIEGLRTPEEDRSGKLFPRTNEDLLKTFTFGGPVPTPVNPKVAASMKKNEDQDKKPRKRRRKKKINSGY
jgi:hypothetical protein